jgi:hypothetical protein
VIDFQYKTEEPGVGESDPVVVWKSGIELADGSFGEVTEERVKDILLDVPFIFDAIKDAAEAITSFKVEGDEAAIKN